MKSPTLFWFLAAVGYATPALQWQLKRATAPADAAHTIDQPVRVLERFRDAILLTEHRSTISRIPVAVSRVRHTRSNSVASLLRHTTSLGDQ